MHLNYQMEVMLLDKNSHNGSCNGYSIWVTTQGGFNLFSCYRKLPIMSIVWFSWVLGSVRQSGQEKYVINTLQLSMSIATKKIL